MKAVVATAQGGPDVLELQQVPDPTCGPDDVVIRIAAAGVNRADILQLKGQHPPPLGAPPYPGLECSGIVEMVGKNVTQWTVGDEVCALLSGGGYAEKVVVPSAQVLPVPRGVTLRDAAALPEALCTIWSTVFMTCHLSGGERLLVHGGSSGIGTFAIQLAKAMGSDVYVTAGSDEKLKVCKQLGADVGINYKEEDFVSRIKDVTQGEGVNVILDIMGAPYFQKNLDALSLDGRLFLLGFMGGPVGELNLAPIIAKRAVVTGAGLRARPPSSKASIVSEVWSQVWPAVEEGKVKPIIYRTFPLKEAPKALQLLQSSEHIGKVLLIP